MQARIPTYVMIYTLLCVRRDNILTFLSMLRAPNSSSAPSTLPGWMGGMSSLARLLVRLGYVAVSFTLSLSLDDIVSHLSLASLCPQMDSMWLTRLRVLDPKVEKLPRRLLLKSRENLLSKLDTTVD